jgi:lipopolysaccharide transport protein LptA/LPS export ABC transporter protein LptC
MKSNANFLFALLLSLILSSFIFTNEIPFLSRIESALPGQKNLTQEKPEYQVNQFSSKQFNEQGFLSSTLTADSLSFFSSNEQSLLEMPTIEIYPQRDFPAKNVLPNWRVKSHMAISHAPNNLVTLNNNVELSQLNSGTPLTVYSQAMDLLLSEKIVKSESLVTIMSNQNEIKGENFESRLQESYMEIKSNVSSQIHQLEKTKKSKNIKQPLLITSGFFKLENQGTKATYMNKVRLKQNNITITADRVEIIKKDNKQLAYVYGKPAYFEQKPTLDQRKILAQAARFEFDSEEQKLKLYQNAKLQQGDAIVEGDYLYYDTKSENVGAESKPNSRVKMTLPANPVK